MSPEVPPRSTDRPGLGVVDVVELRWVQGLLAKLHEVDQVALATVVLGDESLEGL